MVTYAGFLRAINVGGKKLVKMAALREVLESLGSKNVRTLMQSGNVLFEANETDTDALARKIEKKLYKSIGHVGDVVLRKIDNLKNTLRRSPFKKIQAGADVMFFICFLSAEPNTRPRLPLISLKENLEVITITDRAAFVVCRRKKNGLFGFPNGFVEKELGVSATTRKWTTVTKLVALAEAAAEGR